MHYISTRGQAEKKDFKGALTAGLAEDGGLYMPATWPQLESATLAGFAGRPYAEVALDLITRFAGKSLAPRALETCVQAAYASFTHPSVTPLVELAPNMWVLELFHGPTLSFKDIAMQLIGQLMDHILETEGRRATIIGATSGDTGGAAIEAFCGRAHSDVFILFPKGRVSSVQQKQMTTTGADNIYPIAVEGTFDDCQNIVKSLFGNRNFVRETSLSAVNSINWARIAAQVVYYVTTAVALGAPHRPVSFCVPTGNFGDIFAAFVARRMGLPIETLTIATNQNDILVRTLESGVYEQRPVDPSSSPSMDIQISSNFERLLFELSGRDCSAVTTMMQGLKQSGRFTLPPALWQAVKNEMAAGRALEADVAAAIQTALRESGYLLDPHTATAWHVARQTLAKAHPETPTVVLATAHPAKFPEAIVAATGTPPPRPPRLEAALAGKEQFSTLPAETGAIIDFIRKNVRTP